ELDQFARLHSSEAYRQIAKGRKGPDPTRELGTRAGTTRVRPSRRRRRASSPAAAGPAANSRPLTAARRSTMAVARARLPVLCARRRRPLRPGGGRAFVQRLFQELARLEVQHATSRNHDRFTGLRVPPLALPFVAQHEVSKAGDLDLLPAPQGFLHRIE